MALSGNPAAVCAGRCRYARALQTIGIAVCCALLLGLIGSYVMLLRSGDAGIKQSDFIAYYSGAHLVVHGHGAQLYDFHALGRLESALVRPLTVRDGVLPYVYPPYFAVAIAPLGALPYSAAFASWLLLNCLLLGLTVFAVQRYLDLTGRGAVLLWAATLSFLPAFVGLAQGQASVLLLALLGGTFFASRGGRDGLAGVALALALIKPPYVLPFLLVVALQRRWRCLAGFAATALCLAIASCAVLGADSILQYVHTLLQATAFRGQYGYTAPLNHSFAGFTQLLLPATVASAATAALDSAVLLLLARCALRSRAVDLPLGLAALAALLISPHVLIHDLCLALIPVAVALRRWLDAFGRPAGLATLLVLGYGCTLLGLRLVAALPLQLSVLAMTALGCWLLSSCKAEPFVRAPETAPEPVSVPTSHTLAGARRDAGFPHPIDFQLEDY